MSTEKDQATPRPWRIVYEHENRQDTASPHRPQSIRSGHFKSNQMGDYQGVIIAGFSDAHGNRRHAYAESEANAKLIVDAVNSYGEINKLKADNAMLLEACRRVILRHKISNTISDDVSIDILQQAITTAEKE